VVATGGTVVSEALEWPSGGHRLTANSLGGRGGDGKPISRGGRVREGRGGACIREGPTMALGAG
jgi:hypothetical protein